MVLLLFYFQIDGWPRIGWPGCPQALEGTKHCPSSHMVRLQASMYSPCRRQIATHWCILSIHGMDRSQDVFAIIIHRVGRLLFRSLSVLLESPSAFNFLFISLWILGHTNSLLCSVSVCWQLWVLKFFKNDPPAHLTFVVIWARVLWARTALQDLQHALRAEYGQRGAYGFSTGWWWAPIGRAGSLAGLKEFRMWRRLSAQPWSLEEYTR